MEGTHVFGAFLMASLMAFELVQSDIEYMVTNPEPISLSLGFDTILECEMNIDPDKFQWKFYRTDHPFDHNVVINLSNASFELLPESKHTNNRQKKKSVHKVQVDSTNAAGDYQCLAYYGASVVASVPWQLRIAMLQPFPKQEPKDVTVTVGNTVSWMCNPPESNPEVYIDYYKNDQYITPPYPELQSKSLIISNVSAEHSGLYKCSAANMLDTVNSSTHLNLRVVRTAPSKPPFFIVRPRTTYIALKGSTVFLECSAIGNPVPKVVWFKEDGPLPSKRIEMLSGGLKINNVTSSDDGVYVCNHTNSFGTISHHITLVYNEEPSIECLLNTTDIKQGENLDLDCAVSGTPEPYISWFINGFSVGNDSAIEAIGNKIYFRPVEKRHAGNLQLFARNRIKTVYSSISIRVIPLTSSVDLTSPPAHIHHRHRGRTSSTRKPPKHGKSAKTVPPSKPTVSRLNDEAVVVRWSVPDNNGLPIQFFKVQHRDLGPASELHIRNKGIKWTTLNADISPNINTYDVLNLKPDHVYKFRIAAVYSNLDNKLSQNSERFHLKRLDFDLKNPLPIPLLTYTEPINATSVKIHWKCPKSDNVSIAGFYISYMSATTAGDYMRATVDGANITDYVITYLQPDTIYDVKVQSFNPEFVSPFSPLMKARTGTNHSLTTIPPHIANETKNAGFGNWYFILGGVIVGCLLLVIAVVSVIICRKWKRNKSDNRDKATVDDRHAQAEGNEYVEYGQKSTSISRANGCVLPNNRITITPNPLAEADNKNQNVIEMSRLTAQNNNCASVRQESSSGTSQEPSDSSKEKHNHDKGKRSKVSLENVASGENYV